MLLFWMYFSLYNKKEWKSERVNFDYLIYLYLSPQRSRSCLSSFDCLLSHSKNFIVCFFDFFHIFFNQKHSKRRQSKMIKRMRHYRKNLDHLNTFLSIVSMFSCQIHSCCHHNHYWTFQLILCLIPIWLCFHLWTITNPIHHHLELTTEEKFINQ